MQLIPIEKFSLTETQCATPKKLFQFQKAEHLHLMTSTFAKKHTNYLVSYYLVSFYCFLYILRYHCYQFLLLLSFWVEPYVFPLLRKHFTYKTYNVNFTSLYLKKVGLTSRNIVHLLKKYTYVVSVVASIL